MSVLNKLKVDALRRLVDARPLVDVRPLVTRRRYSQKAEDIFKFYSEEPAPTDQYRVLDEKDYRRFLSKRATRREPALTRTMTSLAYKAGKQMISLAEGMPHEDLFPFQRVEVTTREGDTMVIDGRELNTALQYVPSQGLPSLLGELRSYQQQLHRPPALPRDVLVTCGSQHGIFHCVDMLVDPGDVVVTTEYAYTGFLCSLKPYQAEVVGIPEDEDGLMPERLEEVLRARLAQGLRMPKLLYVVPTGNNPTGTLMPAARRARLYHLACQYDFLIIEDDPYMFLNYSERALPSFLSLDTCGRVVRLDSLSKVVSPGLRAAWLTAPGALLAVAERLAQIELLHPCTLSQTIVHRLISRRDSLAAHLMSARRLFDRRRSALGRALLAAGPAADWDTPSAGLYYWVRVRDIDDVYNMVFRTAFERGLMVVPGQAFLYDNNAACPYVRLTFSKINMQDMNLAASHLVNIIADEHKLRLKTRAATER